MSVKAMEYKSNRFPATRGLRLNECPCRIMKALIAYRGVVGNGGACLRPPMMVSMTVIEGRGVEEVGV